MPEGDEITGDVITGDAGTDQGTVELAIIVCIG